MQTEKGIIFNPTHSQKQANPSEFQWLIFLFGIFLFFISSLITIRVNAQVAAYNFSASSGTFTVLSGGNTATLSGDPDDGMFNNVPIGFSFSFQGEVYTTISPVTNGWAALGTTVSNSFYTNEISAAGTRPLLAPLWDDMFMNVSTNFTYLTTGIAGNRVFTAQWLDMAWYGNPYSAMVSFQVKLYEIDNRIEYIYRNDAGTPGSITASIGITSASTGSGSYLSLNNSGNNPTASSTSATNNIASKPATGQIYTFSPPGPCGYSNNGILPLVSDVMPCLDFPARELTITGSASAGTFVTLHVIQGLVYQIYTCNINPSHKLALAIYREGAPAEPTIVYSYSNTGNTCNTESNNVFASFTAPFSGQVRILLNRYTDCSATTPTGISLRVNVSGGSNTLDNQILAGSNEWVGHLYDGTNSGVAWNGNFSNYLGNYPQTEVFNETFVGATACFGPLNSGGTQRATIYTQTFSVRYRMNSSRNGLFVVDLGSDDGGRLAVDGTLVYNNWSDQGFVSRPRVLMNLNGASSLVYDFYENGGDNRVVFQNLTLVLANTLNSNTTQSICLGSAGSAISGDTYGSLPIGISLSGTGYQWTYSTTPGGTRTNITGATGATYTPNTAVAPFNSPGTFYIYRNAVLSSTNNVAPNPYVATNESNATTITVHANVSASLSIAASANPICAGTSVTFTATPANGGTSPSYQWKLNGGNVGTNSPSYTNAALTNGNMVSCVMTSNAPCVSGSPATSNIIIMEVASLIGNNSLDIGYGVHGTTCGTAIENAIATVTAPSGTYIAHVLFASYGTPNGLCGTFTFGSCNATTSFQVTENYLLGNNSAAIPATNGVFGDPCVGTLKQLSIEAVYAEPICTGSSPGEITGTLPTGGNGAFTYLWESSTTSATAGFSNASGINNQQNYTPGNLLQTTWFRRTVLSGSCSSTSRVIQITVTPLITGNTISSDQTVCVGSTPSALAGSTPGGGNSVYVYLWESSTTSASTGFVAASGTNNSQDYTPGTLIQTTWYRRIVTSGGCNNASAAIQISVTPLPIATFSYTGTPYCQNATNPSPTFSGGGVAGTFSSTAGLVFINTATGQVNLAASTAGTYTVTNTIAASGGCGIVTATSSITITTLPVATISYAGSPFCISLVTAQNVTLTGTSGGTYSASPAGITINPSTGAITPNTSTAGTYTVTYTIAAANGCGIVTATTPVTITAVPTATINYPGSPFCISESTPQPVTLNGTGAYTGGSFTSTTGLTINVSTGAITPATSTAGTYTVTYTVPASGGCSAVPATTQVTITNLPVATFSYTESPYCQNAANPSPTFSSGGVAGTFSSTAGLVFANTATGEVNLTASTAGTYTVTNTLPASGGCGIVTATSPITITTQPAATIDYPGSPFYITDSPQVVILTGNTGGIFTVSPAGLSIDAVSGTITPETSSTGTYTVTYTISASGGCDEITATTTVIILNIINVYGSVGADGGYTSLTNASGAFALINSFDQTGKTIEVTISGNSILETGSNSLNAGTWTSLRLYPTKTGILISGNVAGTLINMNGSDQVTIDGRVNATGALKDLTITNPNTGTSASTIRFINSAENNTVKYCTIKGSETSATMGIIFFSTATAGNGNDGNTIYNNNITSDAAGRPVNAIYSAGTAARENSENTISNNNISDFLRHNTTSNGILLAANTTTWSVIENSFFETTPFIPTASVVYNIIQINNPAGINFNVSDNYLGGSAPLCGSSSWTKTNAFNNIFNAINLNVGTATVSNVQNNTIRNFTWSNSSSGAWTGINILAGNVNIGTVAGNTIGDSSGIESIVYIGGATNSNFHGINIASAGVVDCQKNTIGSITADNITSTNATNIFGINKTAVAGTTSISYNFIGSANSVNSIHAGSLSTGNAQSVFGIYSAGTGVVNITNNTIANLTNSTNNITLTTTGIINGIASTAGTNTISDNTIRDLSIANANTSLTNTASVCGLALTGATLKTVTGNTIFNLSNSSGAFAGGIIGLYFTGSTGANVVSGNFIHSLSATGTASTDASVHGIKIAGGNTTYFNNIINLGEDNAATIYGIFETGATSTANYLYFNTVYIGGSLSSGVTNKSYALYSNSTSNTRNFRNNILVNARSTANGANLHYAMYLNYAVTTRISLDYNDYFTPGTGGVLGYYNNSNVYTLPLIAGFDANSLAISPGFINAGGLNATDYKPFSGYLAGTKIKTITKDYLFIDRLNAPTMGAFEGSLILPVEAFTSGVFQSSYPRLKDAFDRINDGTHTGVLELRIKANITENSSAVLYQSGYTGAGGTSDYASLNIYPSIQEITVSGNLNAPLIDLNSADFVTIDGRVNATGVLKDFTITNQNTGTSASTIRFINSAENVTVRYCTMKGSGTSATMGIIFFSTATVGNGNDGNTIINNNITSDAAGRPVNAIYSAGTVARENSENTISNNYIYDFLRHNAASNGILLATNTTAWAVIENSFFETTPFIPTASVAYNIIQLTNVAGVNFNVSDNFMGGSAPLCGSSSWTKTNAFNNIFNAISLSVGTATVSNIQNNTIRNFNWSNSSTGAWTGINITAGNVNIGTIAGNTIGNSSGIESIVYTGGATNSNFYGINIASVGVVDCQNNTIGSITADNNTSGNATNLYGINKTAVAGTTSISYNFIGSATTSNSIRTGSPSTGNAQSLFGIYAAATGVVNITGNTIANLTNSTSNSTAATAGRICGISSISGTNTISNNIIRDLIIANANTSATSISVCGIALLGTTLKSVTGNTIFNLSNTFVAFAGNIAGLYFTGSTGLNDVSGNFIHSLSVTGASSVAASIYGIRIVSGTATYSNNIISLAGNSTSTIYGIYETGAVNNNNDIYFNTVFIGGFPTVGALASYALYNAANTNTRNIRNNIFYNSRSNIGATGKHYAVRLAGTTNLTIDYNDYYVSGNGGVLGYLGSDRTTLDLWIAATGQDANSQNSDPAFTSPGSTIASDYKIGIDLIGDNTTGITLDYGGFTRSNPSIGAWELSINKWKGTFNNDWNTVSNWTGNRVPAKNANIIFDDAPVNHCHLDQDRSVTNITNAQPTYRIVTNGKKLTVKGSLNFSNNAQIDASVTNSIVEFAGIVNQIIPAGTFYNNEVYDLLVNNVNNVTLNGTLRLLNSIIASTGRLDAFTNPANVCFAGISQQTLGSQFLGDKLYNLTIDNTVGVELITDITLDGVLDLKNGTFSMDSKTLTFQNSDTPIARTAGTLTTTENTNLQFGTAGHTGGAAFVIPPGTFTTNPLLNNFVINRENSLTINEQIISLKGVLLCNNGILNTNNNLTLLSSPTQTALIDGSGSGEVLGTVAMQRYLPSGFGYKYVSSPFQDALVGGFAAEIDLNATFPAFYRYDENRDASGWISYVNPTGILQQLAGYTANAGSVSDPKTLSLSGTVNNGVMAPQTFYNHDKTFTKGFNLVGNPYPSPIDWDALSGWTRNNIDNAIYYFDAGTTDQYTGTYSTYINGISSDGTATSIIASMQGFFVHVSDGTYPVSGSFGMDNRVRVNDLSPSFHKSTDDLYRSVIRLSAGFEEGSSNSDPLVIYFDETATSGFENELDAIKLNNSDPGVPNFYALSSEGRRLSIGAWPTPGENCEIPLGIKTEKEGMLTLSLSSVQNLMPGLGIFLKDKTSGMVQDFQRNPDFRVYLTEGDVQNRFALIFSDKDMSQEAFGSGSVDAYAQDGIIYVIVRLKDEQVNVSLHNIAGQSLVNRTLNGEGHHKLGPAPAPGVYVVTVFTEMRSVSKKILIK